MRVCVCEGVCVCVWVGVCEDVCEGVRVRVPTSSPSLANTMRLMSGGMAPEKRNTPNDVTTKYIYTLFIVFRAHRCWQTLQLPRWGRGWGSSH